MLKKREKDHSQRLTDDIRRLLWIITVLGFLLAFYCVYKEYAGALPWITAMVGLPWTAHATVCSFYMNMAKSDHKSGGITYEAAKANGFIMRSETEDSPTI